MHEQKSVSKPLFCSFKVDIDEYMETIQSSVNPKAVKLHLYIHPILSIFIELYHSAELCS